MILIIDNYDSFTYNLVQYVGELLLQKKKNPEKLLKVVRNDEVSCDDVRHLSPERVIISPGPCTPNEAGVSVDLIKEFAGSFPILGVCLGHQSIGAAFGGKIIRAPRIMHGKTSEVKHDGKSLFKGIENPFVATRYHSLIIERKSLPSDLIITAETKEGEIMGVRHKKYAVEGLQFHPESILTKAGHSLLDNFLKI